MLPAREQSISENPLKPTLGEAGIRNVVPNPAQDAARTSPVVLRYESKTRAPGQVARELSYGGANGTSCCLPLTKLWAAERARFTMGRSLFCDLASSFQNALFKFSQT
jgi:hypothetical protein